MMLIDKKPLLEVLKGDPLSPPPFWFMRQAGRSLPEYIKLRKHFSDFIEFCLDASAICEATLQPLHRFQMDAAILFSDILLLPKSCGQTVTFQEKKGPALSPFQLSHFLEQTFLELKPKLSPVFQGIQSIKQHLPKQAALIGFAGGPWTVALYMLEGSGSKDFHKAKTWIFQNKLQFQQMLEHLTELTAYYLDGQLQAGVHLVQVFETWANLVPAPFAEAWLLKPTQHIVDFLKSRHPDAPILAFPKGLGVSELKTYQAFTQVDGLSVDFSVPLERVLDFPCVIQGNLDPSILLAGGDVLKQQTHFILNIMKERPFIFNLGHGILPETPLRHLEELVSYLRSA